MIYLVFFCISVFFAYRAEKARKRSTFIFLSLLSILVTVMLAGFRDISIGIDTAYYYKGYWSWAKHSSSLAVLLRDYFKSSGGRAEALFILFTGVIAKTTGDFHVYLFIVHLIIISCVYIGAFRLREYASPALTLLLFYLLYYNHSLNISRQYIAMAIIFAAMADLERRKFLRFFIFTIIAFLFHTSGVLGVMHLALYLIMYPRKRLRQASFNRRLLVCVLIVVFTVGFVPMVRLLFRGGLLGSHFRSYLEQEESPNPGSVRIMLALELLLLILCWRKIRTSNKHADFYLFCSVAFLSLYQIAPYIYYGKRIAAYFSFANIVTLGATVRAFPKKEKKLIVSTAVIGMVFIYWLYFYFYKNGSKTIPYIIGI